MRRFPGQGVGRARRWTSFSGVIGITASVALAISGVAGASGFGSDGAPSPAPTTTSTTTAPPARRAAPISGGARTDPRSGGLQSDGAPSAPSTPSVGTPTLTVTPATNLKPGQLVTVTGSGFAPSTPQNFGLSLTECRAPATSFDDCGIGDTIGYDARPDALGAFSTSLNVARTLHTPSGSVRCDTTPTTCVLAAFSFSFPAPSLTPVATAALGFDPSVPIPNPTVTVAPASGIRAGQSLAVTGSGFAPGHNLDVFQCGVNEFCDGGSGPSVRVASNGTFSTTLIASLRTTVNDVDLSNCIAVACEVRVEDYTDSEYTTATPIGFDPSQPLPPTPTITVTPSTGLHHDQTVTVAGQGFDAQADVEISQCGPNSFGACSDYLADVVVGADGTFSASATVSRLVRSFDLGPGGPNAPTTVDCATSTCSISASEYSDSGFSLDASAPLAFDGSVPPPVLPTVTAAPLTNLPNRATVTVHGSGFRAGESVYAEQCISGTTFGTCGGFGEAVADATGGVTLTVPVRRTATSFDGTPTDCVDPSVTCQITVHGERSYEQFDFTLNFDPNAPVPPAPTLTVNPNTGLGYRQSVAVHGTGFSPGSPVEVLQCTSGSLDETCAGGIEATADDAGSFDTTVVVRRILGSPFASPPDCAVTQCTLVAAEFGGFGGFGDSVSVNLGFDPNSVAPPPPVLKVSPDDGLHDGDTVDVSGSKFTPNSNVAVLECAGVVDLNTIFNCDLSVPTLQHTDDRGRLTAALVVHTTIAPGFGGSSDCATEMCNVVAFNIEDSSEFASARIAFDVPELEVGKVSVKEGTGGVTPAPVPVSLSEASSAPVTVQWHAQAGSASAADFTAAAGTVVIPAGSTSGVIPAEVVADSMDESTERFTIVVDSATGARIGDSTATVKIKDDDPEPSVSIGDAAVGESGGAVLVPVRLSSASGRAVTVEFRTHHGSARSGRDFTRTRGIVTFAPGQTEVFAMVAITDDAELEALETFRVELDDADHGEITRGTATVTILDND